MLVGARWPVAIATIMYLNGCTDSESEPWCDPACYIPSIVRPAELYVTEGSSTTFFVGLGPGETDAHLQTNYPRKLTVLDPIGVSLSVDKPVETYTLTALADDDAENHGGIFSFIEYYFPGTIGGESPRTLLNIVDTDALNVTASNWNLEIRTPGMSTFDVQLTQPPAETIEVSLEVLCECLPVKPLDPSSVEVTPRSLTFTADTYDVPQTVTVHRLADVRARIELVPSGDLPTTEVAVRGPYERQ